MPLNTEIVLCMVGGPIRKGEVVWCPSANMIFVSGEEDYFPSISFSNSGGSRVENVEYWIEKP